MVVYDFCSDKCNVFVFSSLVHGFIGLLYFKTATCLLLLPLPLRTAHFRLLLKNPLTSSAHSFSCMPPVITVFGWVIF